MESEYKLSEAGYYKYAIQRYEKIYSEKASYQYSIYLSKQYYQYYQIKEHYSYKIIQKYEYFEYKKSYDKYIVKEIDEKLFKKLFAYNNTYGKMDENQIKELFQGMSIDSYMGSIIKMIYRFSVNKYLRKYKLNAFKQTEEDENIRLLDEKEAWEYVQLVNNPINLNLFKQRNTLASFQLDFKQTSNPSLTYPDKKQPQHIKIEVDVGNKKFRPNASIHCKIEKSRQFRAKTPFLVLRIQTYSMYKATKAVYLWDWFLNFIKNLDESPELDYFSCVQISAQAYNSIVKISIEVVNDYLKEIIYEIVIIMDDFFQTEFIFKMELKADFDIDFRKFVQDASTDLLSSMTKDLKMQFEYNANRYLGTLKNFLVGMELLEGFAHVKNDEYSFIFLALFSLREFKTKLSFGSANFNKAMSLMQTFYILDIIKVLRTYLMELGMDEDRVNILYSLLEKPISIEAGIRTVSIHIYTHLNHINQVLAAYHFPLLTGIYNKDPKILSLFDSNLKIKNKMEYFYSNQYYD